MLPPHLMPGLTSDYPAFFARYPEEFGPVISLEGSSGIQRKTQDSFGYEWNWASDFVGDSFPEWFPEGIEPEAVFSSRRGLEIGCGAGRHAEIAAHYAREHFATDLSRAVDPAFERTRNLENCHVIQADAFHLPFKPRSFDYVFCLGVLQHMHDPAEGFRRVAQQAQEGGLLLVNVYQNSRPVMQFLLEVVRKVTTRLPNSVLKVISLSAAFAEYGLFIVPWRMLKRTKLAGTLGRVVPQRLDEYTKHNFHTCATDWFDRLSCPVKLHYNREDLESWYQQAGYREIVVTPFWKAFWNGCGRRLSE